MSLKTMQPFDFYLYKMRLISYQTANYKTNPKKKPRIRDSEADKIFELLWQGDTTKILEKLSQIKKIRQEWDELNNQ